MSTLTQLNSYSNNTISFTDNRPPGVLLTYPQARNVSTITRTGTTFTVQRNIDVDEIINPFGTLNLTFSIDLSALTGAYITWPALPVGVTTTSTSQIYSAGPINSIADWETIKAPTITIPDTFNGTFEYVCTLSYQTPNGIETVTWTVGSFVPVSNPTAIANLTVISKIIKGPGFVRLFATTDIITIPNSIVIDPLVAGDLAQFDYIPGTTNKLLTAAPQFDLRSAVPTVFTLNITTDAAVALEAFRLSPVTTGVTFNYNDATKTATIVGSSTNINTALENLQIDVRDNPVKYYWNFNLIMLASNDKNEYIDRYTLPAISTDATYQSISADDSYALNTPTTIQGGPKVDPGDLLSSGVWTTTIRPLDANQITSLTGGEISGYGPVTLQRLSTTVNPGNESGRRVAVSTNGQYIGAAGDNLHRIYYKASTSWASQKTFDEDNELGNFIWTPDGAIFDMSDDAVYVAYGIYEGLNQFNPTSYSIIIQTRSGTTWLNTAVIELLSPTPSYATRPTQIKLNKTGSKLAIATADGRILIYTRSVSTWSLNDTITGILTKTISGTDGSGDPYSISADYTFSAFDMDPSGSYFAIAMDINYDTSPDNPPGTNVASQGGLRDDRVAIYYGTTLQHDFQMTDNIDRYEYAETGDDPTSVSFNDGATSLIVCNSDVVYLTRSGSTWTDAARIDVAATNVNNSSTTATISHNGLIMAAAGKYDSGADQQEPFVELWALINGTWEYQFTTSGTNQANTIFYEMQSALSGNGEFFGYGNYAYRVGTNYYGEVFMFTLSDYGRFETATKELTIIAPKDQTNTLVDNFTLTPATGQTGVIKLIYETSNPNGIISSRLQNINN